MKARGLARVWSSFGRLPVRKRAAALGLAALASSLVSVSVIWQVGVRHTSYPLDELDPARGASLTLLDRNGELVWHSASKEGGRRTWLPLERISPALVSATLASEDHRFYEHSGIDAWGVLRALGLNIRAGRARYGASTLSMQLVRLLEPERSTRNVLGKLQQAVLAARLERAVSKREILTQYLNRAYYGNGAFGAEAAARQYFGCSAGSLSVGQAAFLAALPRAPQGYDPYKHRARAEERQRHILGLMLKHGVVSQSDAQLALDTPLILRREPYGTTPAPAARHFIDHVLGTLPEAAQRGGTLRTTLDGRLQQQLEVAVRRHIANVGSRRITQAGILVLDNQSGDVLAMVGSHDYTDRERQGAVNVTTLRRRPGSTLKPFVYALALEQGDSPATLAYDVVLPGESNETYTSDVRQHGFARYREALAGSYNLAAVHTLERAGVSALLDRLRSAGISTLDKPDESYGLDLAIGDAEVELIEYTGAFAAFGNGGRPVRARALQSAQVRALPNVFAPAVAYQVFDMLADPDARRPMFARSVPMELPFAVALKTGTTRGYTDNLAFGTTREFTVGAWAGNFDGTPTEGVMAMQGAAPLVRAAFVALAAFYGEPSAPERPKEIVQRAVCALSGQRPGPTCPGRKLELFVPASAARLDAAPPCSFHPPHGAQRRAAVAFPEELTHWAHAHGLADANPRPESVSGVQLVYPPPGTRFELDPYRPAEAQVPPVKTLPADDRVRVTIAGKPLDEFVPSPGAHVVRVERDGEHDEALIVVR